MRDGIVRRQTSRFPKDHRVSLAVAGATDRVRVRTVAMLWGLVLATSVSAQVVVPGGEGFGMITRWRTGVDGIQRC